jgi:Uma2 family endonuclease
MVPEAVVEVTSEGYEVKDIEIGLPFYLEQGVKDVVVYDLRTRVVTHARRDGTRTHVAPVGIDFECGCSCQIPL